MDDPALYSMFIITRLTRYLMDPISSKGGFRDVFLVRHGDRGNYEDVVFKQYHFDSSYVHEDYEYMRIDSLITEIFTSSPLFLNIYRYVSCSITSCLAPRWRTLILRTLQQLRSVDISRSYGRRLRGGLCIALTKRKRSHRTG